MRTLPPSAAVIGMCAAVLIPPAAMHAQAAAALNAGHPGPPVVHIGTNVVRVAAPFRGEVHRFVTQPGTIRAFQQVTLYAKVPGYLKSIAVDKGDTVKVGAVIAQLEIPELDAELPQHHALINKAKVEVARALAEVVRRQAEVARCVAEAKRLMAVQEKIEAEREYVDKEFERLTKARQQSPDLVTQQQLDKAKSDRAVLGASIHAARQTVASAQAEQAAVLASVHVAQQLVFVAQAEGEVVAAALKRTQSLLGYTNIFAPFSGVVTARFVDTGTFIPAATSGNAAQNAAIVTVMDFETVRVQVSMTELETSLVAKGQPVKVTVDGLPGKVFEGQVARLSGALDEATRTMLVECDLPNSSHALRPGMYATVRIGVEKHTNVVLVASEALVMEKAAAFLYLVDAGKVKKSPVKIGFNNGVVVEITSGLAENATVLLAGKLPLTDGQAVNTTEGK